VSKNWGHLKIPAASFKTDARFARQSSMHTLPLSCTEAEQILESENILPLLKASTTSLLARQKLKKQEKLLQNLLQVL